MGRGVRGEKVRTGPNIKGGADKEEGKARGKNMGGKLRTENEGGRVGGGETMISIN